MSMKVFVLPHQAGAVVVGPQGCGKSNKAVEVASQLRLQARPDDAWHPGQPVPANVVVTTNEPALAVLAAHPDAQELADAC